MTTSSVFMIFSGEWSGTGRGEYPTIDPFEYQEILRFSPDERRSVIHYEQKTRRRSAERDEFIPSHWETGFMELLPDGRIEITNAQSGGRVEVLSGSIETTPSSLVMKVQSSHLGNDTRMRETKRAMEINEDTLHYTMHMRTTNVPHLAIHLEATLRRS